jgi:signal transduction histidine kinase
MREGEVLVAPFDVGDALSGAVVVSRDPGRGKWRLVEVEALDQIARDLSRGVDQARLYQEQQQLVRELMALDRTKGEFVSNVSHELRTPMTSVVGYVEMMLEDRGSLTEHQSKMLEVVHRNAVRLQRLIEELLLLAKLESGSAAHLDEAVDLCELAQSVVDVLSPVAQRGGVTLERTEHPEPLVVQGDHAHLDRMLTNLVSNAVKFTPEDGRVLVGVHRVDDSVEVEVVDTGIGIPKSQQADVFTRFTRATNATERAIPGTGLGLAIVRQIVDRHGGTISLDSEEGMGTTVRVRLPVALSTQASAVAR